MYEDDPNELRVEEVDDPLEANTREYRLSVWLPGIEAAILQSLERCNTPERILEALTRHFERAEQLHVKVGADPYEAIDRALDSCLQILGTMADPLQSHIRAEIEYLGERKRMKLQDAVLAELAFEESPSANAQNDGTEVSITQTRPTGTNEPIDASSPTEAVNAEEGVQAASPGEPRLLGTTDQHESATDFYNRRKRDLKRHGVALTHPLLAQAVTVLQVRRKGFNWSGKAIIDKWKQGFPGNEPDRWKDLADSAIREALGMPAEWWAKVALDAK